METVFRRFLRLWRVVTTKRATTKPRTQIDWEAVERDFRAGVMSLAELGKKHGCSKGAISKKADKHGWTRDLKDKIKTATAAKLARAMATVDAPLTDEQIIESNAQAIVQIIREHRGSIQRARAVCLALLAEVGDATANIQALVDAVVEDTKGDEKPTRRKQLLALLDTGARAATLQRLSQALKDLVTLERQAFGVDEQKSQEPDYEATLKALHQMEGGDGTQADAGFEAPQAAEHGGAVQALDRLDPAGIEVPAVVGDRSSQASAPRLQ